MCDRPSTGREHIPPHCFFPADYELPRAEALRRNLIVVPSCDEHNLGKSHDDEYLLAIIVSQYEVNPIGLQIGRRVLRAVRNRPEKLNTFFPGLRPAYHKILGNTGIFHVDLERFQRALIRLARGIYYYHHNFTKKAPKHEVILSPSVMSLSDAEINKELSNWRDFSNNVYAHLQRYGQNQPIFYYQMLFEANGEAVRLVFYDGFVIDVAFKNENQFSEY